MYDALLKKLETSAGYRMVFGLLLAGVFVGIIFVADRAEKSVEPEAAIVEAPPPANPFASVILSAEAAYVFEVATGKVLYAHNEEAQLPLASVVKVLTAVVAEEALGPDNIVTIQRDAVRADGDSGLLIGESWRVKDLIDLTLTASANDGAAALAAAVSALPATTAESSTTPEASPSFGDRVAETIQKIGMDQTYLVDPSGLDVSDTTSGAYGSAHDVARLFAYVVTRHPSLLEATTEEAYEAVSLEDLRHAVYNTNEIIARLPAALGSKTGFTTIAGGNLAIVFEAGPMRPIVVVVLGSTREGRFSDVEQLVWATIHSIQKKH